MATHSSSLSWEIPWSEEPGGLQSMGSQSVSQDQRPNNKHVRDTDFSAYMKEGRKEIIFVVYLLQVQISVYG